MGKATKETHGDPFLLGLDKGKPKNGEPVLKKATPAPAPAGGDPFMLGLKKKESAPASEPPSTDLESGTEPTRPFVSRFSSAEGVDASITKRPTKRTWGKPFIDLSNPELYKPKDDLNLRNLYNKPAQERYNQRMEADFQDIVKDIYYGNTSGAELKRIYNTSPIGRDIIKQVANRYEPNMSDATLDKPEFGMAQWNKLARSVIAENRKNAVEGEKTLLGEIDADIKEAVDKLQTVTTFTYIDPEPGGSYSKIEVHPFKKIDTNNPEQLGSMIDQLSVAEAIQDKDGNKLSNSKIDELMEMLVEKQTYLTSLYGVHPDIQKLTPDIEKAIVKNSLDRNRDMPLTSADHLKQLEQFKLGLTYIKNTKPVVYGLIIDAINQQSEVSEDDYRDISYIGQKIFNQQMYRGAATNPELIGAETDYDYTTRSDKKEAISALISERIKQAGIKNKWQYDEELIKKHAYGIKEQDIVNELIQEEKIKGYDAFQKTGSRSALDRGILQPISGITNTFRAIVESPAETYLRSKRHDVGIGGQEVRNEKGEYGLTLPSDRGGARGIWYKMMEGLGQFLPQIALAKAAGVPVGGALRSSVVPLRGAAALSPATIASAETVAGTMVSTYLQTYGDSYADALQKTGDHALAALMGNINAINAASWEAFILPDVKIAEDAMKALRNNLATDLVGVIQKHSGDIATLAKKGRPFIEKFVAKALDTSKQEVGEELGTQLVDYMTEAIFSPRTAVDRNLGKEMIDTAWETALSMAIPSIFGGGAEALHRDFTRGQLDYSAINFNRSKKSLEDQFNAGRISNDEKNKAIQILATHQQSIFKAPKTDINGKKLTYVQQNDYAHMDTQAKIYRDNAAESEGVTKKMWEDKLKEVEKAQTEIINPSIIKDEKTSKEGGGENAKEKGKGGEGIKAETGILKTGEGAETTAPSFRTEKEVETLLNEDMGNVKWMPVDVTDPVTGEKLMNRKGSDKPALARTAVEKLKMRHDSIQQLITCING